MTSFGVIVALGLGCTPKAKEGSANVVTPEAATATESSPTATKTNATSSPEQPDSTPKKATTPEADSPKTESKKGEAKQPAAPIKVADGTNKTPASAAPTVATNEPPEAAPPPSEEVPAEANAAEAPAPTNSEDYATCKTAEQLPATYSRKDTYSGAPFQPGERSEYEMSYMGVLAGSGAIIVDRPTKKNDYWHRVYRGEAKTGDWYKYIFILRDKIVAWSRPWDFGIAKFYMEQDEGKLFSSRYIRKKWIDFDHSTCKTSEKEQRKGRAEKNSSFDLRRGAVDTLGATFYLRSLDYEIGKKQNVMIYSSEKNWLLEANPVAIEKIETTAGTFNATKLKLQTYIGQDLQQKGDVYIWIANDRPERPMVQVKAEIKIGSIWIKLKKYQAGRPL